MRNLSLERLASMVALSAALLWAMPSQAGGPLTAEDVRAALKDAPAGKADLSGKVMRGDDLSGLDLSGANLTRADLSGTNLNGVKLVGSNLTEADLTRADLTGAWIMKANFNRATLHGATLQVVITSEGMENQRETAASFVAADLSDTDATVHFSYDDMRGANFTGTRMSVVLANQSMGILRSEFKSANLEGANFTNAGLGHITFAFANLTGANFTGADLTRAEFTGANLTNADFTGAKLDYATFEQANLTGAKGLPPAGGAR